jgi:CubicO group peptidase (beta-lactamase class C family)
MRAWIRLVLAALGVLLLWTAVAGWALLEGFGRSPLAPRGDTQAFLSALVHEVETARAGNLGLALLEGGSVAGEHMSSVGEPVDRDTAFQVASLSKWVTAWGVMTLVEQGRLDLDAPVSGYLTRWTLPESEFDNHGVTVRRLLSHTAGLTDGLGYAGFPPGSPVQTLEASLRRASDASPGANGSVRVGHAPGERFEYSGGGYTLLQLLVEEVSGEPFEVYMRRSVFEPLGMHHSTFEWDESRGTKLAAFYDEGSKPATHYRFTAQAAASLYTTVGDMARFVQAHLPGARGEPVGRGVLRADTLGQMRQPHASRLGQDVWGLGTILYAPNGAGGHVIGHDGSNQPAINTAVRFDPATGNGIVVLETGNPLLATRLAGEWVFWETGNLDVFTVTMEAVRMLTVIASGWLVIVLGAVALAWRRRARSRGASEGTRAPELQDRTPAR